ncbi:MAG: hypothetical protein QGH60_19510 [Phycisphaerae bacterium]|jgi:drug/metabolite transporter (DMT)-like permease|nr:hypothetical protein [Phycisphaerae bacterium]
MEAYITLANAKDTAEALHWIGSVLILVGALMLLLRGIPGLFAGKIKLRNGYMRPENARILGFIMTIIGLAALVYLYHTITHWPPVG